MDISLLQPLTESIDPGLKNGLLISGVVLLCVLVVGGFWIIQHFSEASHRDA